MLLIGAHSQVHCDSRLNKAHLTHVFSIMHITDFCAWNIRQHFGTVLGAILNREITKKKHKNMINVDSVDHRKDTCF